MKRKVKMSILIKQSMKHVESKLFNQNGHFYFSFQICITCTYLTNIFGYRNLISACVIIFETLTQIMNIVMRE